jgi:hypothetical protein
MRAYARVALVSMGVPASLGLAGCAAIEELRDAFLRWVESEKPPSGPGMIADDLPAATPRSSDGENAERAKQAGAHSRKIQRANRHSRRSLRFRERNRRSRIPRRRRSQKAPRGNPRRLPLHRRNCLVAFRQHRHRDSFRADARAEHMLQPLRHLNRHSGDSNYGLTRSGFLTQAARRAMKVDRSDGAHLEAAARRIPPDAIRFNRWLTRWA